MNLTLQYTPFHPQDHIGWGKHTSFKTRMPTSDNLVSQNYLMTLPYEHAYSIFYEKYYLKKFLIFTVFILKLYDFLTFKNFWPSFNMHF